MRTSCNQSTVSITVHWREVKKPQTNSLLRVIYFYIVNLRLFFLEYLHVHLVLWCFSLKTSCHLCTEVTGSIAVHLWAGEGHQLCLVFYLLFFIISISLRKALDFMLLLREVLGRYVRSWLRLKLESVPRASLQNSVRAQDVIMQTCTRCSHSKVL